MTKAESIGAEKELAKEVWDALNGCNLSGIARSFIQATEVLWDIARARGQGTEFVNRHPVCRLYLMKMGELAGVTTETEVAAIRWADKIVSEQPLPATDAEAMASTDTEKDN